MENIEEKLRKYRLHKRRKEKIQQFKESIKCFLMFGANDNEVEHIDKPSAIIHGLDYNNHALKQQRTDSKSDSDDIPLSTDEDTYQHASTKSSLDLRSRILKYTLRAVYIAFWITLYIIAIELQFGVVFLMFSALAAIYLNTRTGPKKRSEISAYSVFNKNCESIDGTLKAEQFEKEIGIR